MVFTERMSFLNFSKVLKEAFFYGGSRILFIMRCRGQIHGDNIFE